VYSPFEIFQTENILAHRKATPPASPDRRPKTGATRLKNRFLQDYGQGYQSFGLPKLMGQIVGLLLYHPGPLSLDDITEELRVSKGPVSQVMRRLRDHKLVNRVWVPGSRRDHYEAAPDIFGQAFANHAALQHENLGLARRYHRLIQETEAEIPGSFAARMEEMDRFYTLMEKHFANFLEEWQESRAE
jgi:DNA-binding transcriptional regulator GbsR (MarR family)